MSCMDIARDVDAYVDRELDPQAAARIREHLAGCETCRSRVDEREELGRLVRSAAYYTAPDRLRARVAAQAARSASTHRLLTLAAAAALIVSTGVGLMFLRPVAFRGDTAIEEVVSAHVRSQMGNHLFDVESTDQHTVKPWFLGKLDFSPPVTDLAARGFPLVGGRLDYIDGRAVAALVYKRRQHTINVFVSPVDGRAIGTSDGRSLRGFHVHHWIRDGMSFWAVSDVNDADLTEFVAALKTQ